MPDCKFYNFLICEKLTHRNCKEPCYYGKGLLGFQLINKAFPIRIRTDSCLLCNHFRGQGVKCHVFSRANFILSGCSHWIILKPSCENCKSYKSSRKCERIGLCDKYVIKLDRFGKFDTQI